MAKDLGGFMKSFAGNLGTQLSGMNLAGNPMSGIGIAQQLFGGGADEDNPGMKMFKGNGSLPAANEANFGQRFLKNMQDQLFQSSMTNFMGGRGY